MLVILTIILLIPAAAAASYFCYRLAFSVPEQSREALFEMPDTEQYAPYSAEARQMISDALEIPYKEADFGLSGNAILQVPTLRGL